VYKNYPGFKPAPPHLHAQTFYNSIPLLSVAHLSSIKFTGKEAKKANTNSSLANCTSTGTIIQNGICTLATVE